MDKILEQHLHLNDQTTRYHHPEPHRWNNNWATRQPTRNWPNRSWTPNPIPKCNHTNDTTLDEGIYEPEFAPKDFEHDAWLNPDNSAYGRGKQTETQQTKTAMMAHRERDLTHTESAFVVLAKDEPNSYREAMNSPEAKEWRPACEADHDILMGYHIWKLIEKPPNVNIIRCWWTFRVKRDNLGAINKYKARLVTQGFTWIEGLNYHETFSPTFRFTTIRLILVVIE